MNLDAARYTTREAMAILKLKSTAFWARTRDGRLKIQRDGTRVFVSGEELKRYLAACEQTKAA